MLYTVAVGNAFDGIELRGTFDEQMDAVKFAEENYSDTDWTVVKIQEA